MPNPLFWGLRSSISTQHCFGIGKPWKPIFCLCSAPFSILACSLSLPPLFVCSFAFLPLFCLHPLLSMWQVGWKVGQWNHRYGYVTKSGVLDWDSSPVGGRPTLASRYTSQWGNQLEAGAAIVSCVSSGITVTPDASLTPSLTPSFTPVEKNEGTTRGTIRIVDGPTAASGRVELWYDKPDDWPDKGPRWGTVCDRNDRFDRHAAAVVCRMLGLAGGEVVPRIMGPNGWPVAQWPGTGPFWLRDVRCSGIETSIGPCSYPGSPQSWGENADEPSWGCGHHNDVAVKCEGVGQSVRLVDGPDLFSGRVEVLHDRQWGTVCDDGWSTYDARVVCWALGLRGGTAKSRAHYGSGSGPIWLRDVRCRGSEDRLEDCSHSGWGSHQCSHREDAGVACDGYYPLCTTNERVSGHRCVRCPRGETNEAGDDAAGPDTECHGAPTPVRLVGGGTRFEGRVEVLRDGEWGTVCDDDFGADEAKVVCTMIGSDAVSTFHGGAYFGQGSGPVWLDGVRCSGREGDLALCRHPGFGAPSDCSHAEDVAVICVEPPPPVRLVGGPNGLSGRVEVLHHGEWGTVCHREWDDRDATVVCRQLGHFGGRAKTNGADIFGEGSGRVWLDLIRCTGAEDNLLDCPRHPHGDWGYTNCHHSQDAGVVCKGGDIVRLADGPSRYEGRVEVWHVELPYPTAAWGTVCDDDWGDEELEVVCTALGLLPVQTLKPYPWYGSAGTGEIWLSGLHCSGTEDDLHDCLRNSNYWGARSHHCAHHEDSWVVCKAPPPEEPTLQCPSPVLEVAATRPAGAYAHWIANATDVKDGVISDVTCTRQPGEYPVGDTTVSCSATDSEGNTGTCDFTIRIQGSCTDGFQAGDETAVDCGGSCAPCGYVVLEQPGRCRNQDETDAAWFGGIKTYQAEAECREPCTAHAECGGYIYSATGSCLRFLGYPLMGGGAGFGAPPAHCVAKSSPCGKPADPLLDPSACNTNPTSCTADCITGYRGNMSLDCIGEEWQYRYGYKADICMRGSCGPPRVAHATAVACRDRWAFGDSCDLTCEPWYQGQPQATCEVTGSGAGQAWEWVYTGQCIPAHAHPPDVAPAWCAATGTGGCGGRLVPGCGTPCGVCGMSGDWFVMGEEAEYQWHVACDWALCPELPGVIRMNATACEAVADCYQACPPGYARRRTAACTADGAGVFGGDCVRACGEGYAVAAGEEGAASGWPVTTPASCATCATFCDGDPACVAYTCDLSNGTDDAACTLFNSTSPAEANVTSEAVLCKRQASVPGDAHAARCPRPHHPAMTFTACDHSVGGSCVASCKPEYTGAAVAVCGSAGRWEYTDDCAPRTWLHVDDDGAWYLSLPPGNTATRDGLTTTWHRLRIVGLLTKGMSEIRVSLQDAAYADAPLGSPPMPLGSAEDCQPWGHRILSALPDPGYRINLTGTPFRWARLPPRHALNQLPDGRAHMHWSRCQDGGVSCQGGCAGGCARCGLGEWGVDAAFPLAVANGAVFDAGLPPLNVAPGGCPSLTDERACVRARDGRRGEPYYGQACAWCCGGSCTLPGQPGCEPREWLKAQTTYTGHSRDGIRGNSCPLTCSQPPSLPHTEFPGCGTNGTCTGVCLPGTTGSPVAVCDSDGVWQYDGEPCTRCTDTHWWDIAGHTCANHTDNAWCTADGGLGPGWSYWGDLALYAVGPHSAADVCCGCGADRPCPHGDSLVVQVGPSQTASKVLTLTEPVLSCHPVCGPGCRVNADYADAGDVFRVTVAGAQIAVDRVDVAAGWHMDLRIRCCPSCALGFVRQTGYTPNLGVDARREVRGAVPARSRLSGLRVQRHAPALCHPRRPGSC